MLAPDLWRGDESQTCGKWEPAEWRRNQFMEGLTFGAGCGTVEGMMDKSISLATRYLRTAPLARADEVIE